MAILAALTANIAQGGKRGKKFAAKDFMPMFGPKQQQTPEQMLAMAEQLNAAFGGLDLRKAKVEQQ